jgi:hypothetical protein
LFPHTSLSPDQARSSIQEHFASIWSILGANRPASRIENEIMRTFVACTPVLRARLVFDSPTSDSATRLPLASAPYFLCALYALTLLAHDAGMDKITYQTIAGLLTHHRDLLTVLARANCEVAWDPEKPIQWPLKGRPESDVRYLRVIKDLIAGRRRTRSTVAEILCEHAPRDNPGRILFLKTVSHVLANCMRASDQPASVSEHAGRVRRAVQRWAFATASPQMLLAVAGRQRVTQGEAPSSSLFTEASRDKSLAAADL